MYVVILRFRGKDCWQNLPLHRRRASSFLQHFRWNRVTKEAERRCLVFICRFVVSLYPEKPCSDYGSNDMNIYLPSNLFYDRVSLLDNAKAEQIE